MMELYSIGFLAFLIGLLIASIIWFFICISAVKLYKEVSTGYNNLYEEYKNLKQQVREYESKRTKEFSQRDTK